MDTTSDERSRQAQETEEELLEKEFQESLRGGKERLIGDPFVHPEVPPFDDMRVEKIIGAHLLEKEGTHSLVKEGTHSLVKEITLDDMDLDDEDEESQPIKQINLDSADFGIEDEEDEDFQTSPVVDHGEKDGPSFTINGKTCFRLRGGMKETTTKKKYAYHSKMNRKIELVLKALGAKLKETGGQISEANKLKLREQLLDQLNFNMQECIKALGELEKFKIEPADQLRYLKLRDVFDPGYFTMLNEMTTQQLHENMEKLNDEIRGLHKKIEEVSNAVFLSQYFLEKKESGITALGFVRSALLARIEAASVTSDFS